MSRSFPRVDDHLVQPETREEFVRGRMMLALPADVARATCHSIVNYVTRGAIAPGYVGASGLLTRFGPDSDFGTDTCIRREGIDPTTGARYLEELVIEVVHEESLADLTERAEILTARGVRRVVAISIDEQEAREWQAGAWVPLDPSGMLDDPTLVEPIPVRALFDTAEADRTVLRALRTKKDPDLMALEAEAKQQQAFDQAFEQAGAATLAKHVVDVCEVLEIPLDVDRLSHVERLGIAGLKALLTTLRTERRWP